MRIHTDLPEWMTHGYLEGNEDPPAGSVITPPPAADTDPPEVEDEDEVIPEDLTGIKSALSKTRDEKKAINKQYREAEAARKAAEARLKEIDDKDKSEVDKAKEAQTAADAKLAKLAEGYKTNAIKSAVEKAARDAKFLDPEDAYKGVDVSDLEAEQDADDPSKVTIDPKAVKKLVEDLAKKKPYLTGESNGSGEPSGSRFNGGNNKDPKKMTQEQLINKYPGLR